MRAVLALLLVAGGLGLVYTGYAGHLPGGAALPGAGAPSTGVQDPFAGIGNMPPGWTTGPNSGIPAGTTIGSGVQQHTTPVGSTIGSGIAGGLPK